MSDIKTLAGVDCLFGGRWDEPQEKAKHRAVVLGTTGYFDVKEVPKHVYPAAGVALALVEADESVGAYAIFYCDDDGEIFASVVVSGDQIAPSSETVYDSVTEWESAIVRTLRDSNIDSVYAPDGAAQAHEKLQTYAIDPSAEPDLSKTGEIKTGSKVKDALILSAFALVLAGIGGGTWVYLTDPFASDEQEFRIVTEKTKIDYTVFLESCGEALSDPWPSAPEWSLVQEGCVGDPAAAQIGFPRPNEQRPYAYRVYELSQGDWNSYLSREAFLRIAERFPGQLVQSEDQFVLYVPQEVPEIEVDETYVANDNPIPIVEQQFISGLEVSGSGGVGGFRAITPVEIDQVLERLEGKALTPNHVQRDIGGNTTRLEVAPEVVDTRQRRVPM